MLNQIDERGQTMVSTPVPSYAPQGQAQQPPPPAAAVKSDADLDALLGRLSGAGIEKEQSDTDGHPAEFPPAPEATIPQPSVALQNIMTELHQKNAEWAQEQVARLDSLAELDRAERLERDNPSHKSGRTSVLRAIQARRIALSQPAGV